jgi:hypothetical protein
VDAIRTMLDKRPLWMRLATCREDACISAHYSLEVIKVLQRYCLEITAMSIDNGFIPMLSELEQILEEEREIAEQAIESGDWMPDLG